MSNWEMGLSRGIVNGSSPLFFNNIFISPLKSLSMTPGVVNILDFEANSDRDAS